MIYITQCNVCLSFIYRYAQMFNVVSSCHAADVPSVSNFIANPMNHVCICGCNHFCYPCPQFFQTCRKRWNKNFVFNVFNAQLIFVDCEQMSATHFLSSHLQHKVDPGLSPCEIHSQFQRPNCITLKQSFFGVFFCDTWS